MRVLNIINSLHVGGAERNLLRLTRLLVDQGLTCDIATLRSGGELEMDARAMTRLYRWPNPRLPAYDIVMGRMYAGAVAASIEGRRAQVIWNIRHLPEHLNTESLTTRLALKLLSRFKPQAIVTNAHAAIAAHQKLNLSCESWKVIPNAVDSRMFVRFPHAREALRAELGIDEGSLVFLQVARVHPHKGNEQLVAAFNDLGAQGQAHLVLVGEGTRVFSNGTHIHGVGIKDHVVDYFSAADVLINPSLSESSPTVVREAMCCELPCIVTPVGDAQELVGDTGFCVPGERAALTAIMAKVLTMDRSDLRHLGVQARARVCTRMDETTMVDAYLSLFETLAAH